MNYESGYLLCIFFIKINCCEIINNLKKIVKYLAKNLALKIKFYPVLDEEISDKNVDQYKQYIKDFELGEFQFYALPIIKEDEDHDFRKYLKPIEYNQNASIIYDSKGIVRYIGTSSYITKEFLEMIYNDCFIILY